MHLWLHLSSDFEPNSPTFFYHFHQNLYIKDMYFSCSYNAFEYILTHTEVICLKVSCNLQKVEERYFSSTENFLFNFLMVQSPARRGVKTFNLDHSIKEYPIIYHAWHENNLSLLKISLRINIQAGIQHVLGFRLVDYGALILAPKERHPSIKR